MNKSISFSHLNKTDVYHNHLDDLHSHQIGYSFLKTIKEQLPLSITSIFISNHNQKTPPKTTYILRLERDKITLYETSSSTKNTSVFHFANDTITLNKNLMSPIFKKAFKRRLSEIIKDLKNNACSIYEEPI